MFTGNDCKDLPIELIKWLDLIIDGKFDIKNRDNVRNLIGSCNQKIIDVSGRYINHLDWFIKPRPDFIEIDVYGDLFVTNGSIF